jgi:sugar/nucleoside kinase (ribokinase family)
MLESRVAVVIGHVTNDITPHEHLGGGVSYAAVTAERRGFKTHMITKLPPDHPYVKDLRSMGIIVHVLPSKSKDIITFKNTYDTDGKRQQVVSKRQEPITREDYQLDEFPKDILNNATVIAAPVIGEVDPGLFPIFKKSKFFGLLAQGNLRAVGPDGKVFQKRWPKEFDQYLNDVDVTVLSDEDMTINEKFDEDLLRSIAHESDYVALTRGAKGATIYKYGSIDFETGAFALEPKEIDDPTGAGDLFGTIFITELVKENSNLKKSALTATLFSALKIMKRAGIGIDSIPTKKQFIDFKKEYDERIKEFYEREKSRKRPHFKMV